MTRYAVGLIGLAALLAACGDDEGDTGAGSGGSGATGTGGAATTGTGGATTTGTGGSGGATTGTGGSGGGPLTGEETCALAGDKAASAAAAAGCTDNSAEVEAGCMQLYASNTCIPEWEAVFNCSYAVPDDQWTCNASNNPSPPCPTEVAAFDACVDN